MANWLTKLALKDMGNPKIIATQPETVREIHLGVLMGQANDFVTRTIEKDSSVMEGLAGNFRVVPVDLDGTVHDTEAKESGILWIPDAFHNIIAGKLRAAKATDPGATIDFIFDVVVIRANNPQGYSWQFNPIREFSGKNPLDELFNEYGATKHAQIAAREKAKQLEDKSSSKRK